MTTTPTSLSRPLAQDIASAALREIPELFVSDVLGSPIYSKQIEMCRAVQAYRRTSVTGCNSSGKDFVAARIVLWWMNTRHPARALVYGPTTRQVDGIVFSEMRTSFSTAPVIDGYKMRGRMFETSSKGYEVGKESNAIGFATRSTTGTEGQVFNLAGFHSPHLLVIITEAHAITQSEYDAVMRLGPERVLMTGNPFVSSGPFYEAHHGAQDRWHTISISAFDTPNLTNELGRTVPGMVTPEDIEDRRVEWGEESALYVGSVLGQFPDNLDDMLIPLWAATEATLRNPPIIQRAPKIIACDVAREGVDKTAIVRRHGAIATILWSGHDRDTQHIADRLQQAADEDKADFLVVDDVGVGGGVTDRLRRLQSMGKLTSTRVVAFKGGAKARDSKDFANANAEVYWRTRLWLMEEGSIPDDRELIGQLVSRRHEINSKQQIVLESKKDAAKRGIKSPDKADALAMTHAIRVRESSNTEAGARKESLWS